MYSTLSEEMYLSLSKNGMALRESATKRFPLSSSVFPFRGLIIVAFAPATSSALEYAGFCALALSCARFAARSCARCATSARRSAIRFSSSTRDADFAASRASAIVLPSALAALYAA